MRIGEKIVAEQTQIRQKNPEYRAAAQADFSASLRKATEQAGALTGSTPMPRTAIASNDDSSSRAEKNNDFRRRFWEIIKGNGRGEGVPASTVNPHPGSTNNQVENQYTEQINDASSLAKERLTVLETNTPNRTTDPVAEDMPPLPPRLRQNHDNNYAVHRIMLAKPPVADMAPELPDDTASGERVFLGVVNQEAPSVSHLLAQNPNYSNETWDIIHAGVNRGKSYRKISQGASVYINPKTMSLSWDGMVSMPNVIKKDSEPPVIARMDLPSAVAKKMPSQDFPSTSTPDAEREAVVSGVVSVEPPAPSAPSSTEIQTELVSIGRLSRSVPTIGKLLKRHPEYQDDTWRILGNPVNHGKPFTSMQLGTEVFLDPKTDELSWGDDTTMAIKPTKLDANVGIVQGAAEEASKKSTTNEELIHTPRDLAASVEPYFGRSYREFDCYGLVVQGLKEMGVDYSGPDGLKDHLVKLATDRGLPANAYLNGEGLIEASGSRVYSKSLPTVKDPDKQAEEVFREMEPLLNRGCILSFSTPTRGHTGIVSRRDERWTYINSGQMDNDINNRSGKRVGEEGLREEVGNWFRLARDRHESLSVTLGRLEEEKLRTTAGRESGAGSDMAML